MLKICVLASVAAAAYGQAVLTSNQFGSLTMETVNGATISRREEFSIYDMSRAVENSLNNMAQELAEARSQLAASTSPIALGVQAIASDMTARSMTLLETESNTSSRIDGLAIAVANAAAATNAANEAVAATVANSVGTLQNTVNTETAALSGVINTQINAVMGSLASTTVAINAATSTSTANLQASVANQIRQVNSGLSTATAAMLGKRDALPHIFMGSCSSTPHGNWRDYCLDRTDVDTSRPYFRKASNTRLTSITSGYFSMQFYRLYQSCNWEHTLLYFDGSHRRHTHMWSGGNSHWRDAEVMLTYPLAANKQFYARAWNCGWTVWNTSPHHSRFMAKYEGKLPA